MNIKDNIIKIKDYIHNIRTKAVALGDKRGIVNYVLGLNVVLIASLAILIAFMDNSNVKNYTSMQKHINSLNKISKNYELSLTKAQVTLQPAQTEMSDISKRLQQEKNHITVASQKISDTEYVEYINHLIETLDKRLQVRDELNHRFDNLYMIYKDYRKIALESEKALENNNALQVKVKHIMLNLESVRLMAQGNNRNQILKDIQALRFDIINESPDIQEKVGLFSERAGDVIKLLRYLDTIKTSMQSDGYDAQLLSIQKISQKKIDDAQFFFNAKIFLLLLIGIILAGFQMIILAWFFIQRHKTDRLRIQALDNMEKSKIIVSRAKQYALDAQRGQYKLLRNFCGDFSFIIDNISGLTKNIEINIENGNEYIIKNNTQTLCESVDALETWLGNYLNIHHAQEEWRTPNKEKIDIKKITGDIFTQARFYAKDSHHKMSIFHADDIKNIIGDSEYIRNIYMNMVYIVLKWSEKDWLKTILKINDLSPDEKNKLQTDADNSPSSMLSISVSYPSSESDFDEKKALFLRENNNHENDENNDESQDRFVSAALYFSRQIGDLLGAKFELTRSIASDNILTVHIPVALDNDAADKNIGVPILRNKTAIIVSPYSNILYTLEQQLKLYGMNVCAISDRYAAIGHIVGSSQSGESFDIIILDHRPPECDALMLAKIVRENTTSGLVHIIVLTTQEYLPELQENMINIDAVMTKPVRPEILHEKLEHFIQIQLYGEDVPAVGISDDIQKSNTKRFLAIMSEDLSSSLIKMVVSKQNFHIDIATTAAQVMEALDQNPYDFILISNKGTWIVPENLIRDIRRHHTDNKNAVTMLLYEDLKKAQHNKLIKAGFDEFIELPLIKNTLLETITSWNDPETKRLSILQAKNDKQNDKKSIEEKIADIENTDTSNNDIQDDDISDETSNDTDIPPDKIDDASDEQIL